MAIGKLIAYDGDFMAEVNYRLFEGSEQGWWGELTLTEYRRLRDGDGYIIELDER